MATRMPLSGWPGYILQELAPTHGRMAGALRTATAALAATAVLLYLQISMLAAGVYLIFLISYDAPYLTLKHSLQELFAQTIGVTSALLLVVATDNAPMARVLGIAGFTFLSAFLLRASNLRWLALPLGVFPVFTLTMWEMHLPAGELVCLSYMQVWAGAIAIGVKIALEYMFTRRDPYRALQMEMRSRLEAAGRLFEAIGANADGAKLRAALRPVARYAFAGQGKMVSLMEELGLRPPRELQPGEIPPILAPQAARLMELAAAFGSRFAAKTAECNEATARTLISRLRALAQGASVATHWPRIDSQTDPILLQLEEDLDTLGGVGELLRKEATTPPAAATVKKRTFRIDAFSNPDYALFASKLSLCSALCYVLYNAMAWPGISTACITVLIAGLSSSGATNQKMFFRVIGSLLGGVVLGLGCQIFLYPRAETVFPFLLSIFAVSFLGAWIARGAHFGYVGMQIVFSFYLVAFQEYMVPMSTRGEFASSALPVHGFTAPLNLALGRDRVLGILLALAIMTIVFLQLHPRRAIDRMRSALGALLRVEAMQIAALRTGASAQDAALRSRASELVIEIRTQAEAIPFEMDQRVEQDQTEADAIQQAVIHAGALRLRLNVMDRVRTEVNHDAIQASLESVAAELLEKDARVDAKHIDALKKLARVTDPDFC